MLADPEQQSRPSIGQSSPPKVSRSAGFDAVVERIATDSGGEWSADPLEAALGDIRRQQREQGIPTSWTTYHPPGYRITVTVSAADADSAQPRAVQLLDVPSGWRVDPQFDVKPTA